MRRSIRKAGVACGAAFASAALALSTSAAGSAQTTAVMVGGLGTPRMHEIVMAPLLGGRPAATHDILDDVEWPAEAKRPGTGRTLGQSIAIGVTNLGVQFAAADGRLEAGESFTVIGFSAGSLVVNDFMRELANDPNAPGKDQVKFILVADSSRQKLLDNATKYNPQYDYTYRPAPETAYDIDVVTGEYDGAADMPDRPWNILAVINAIAGGITVHVPMMFADYVAVTPEENITRVVNSKGGVTTTYLVPTKKLPIVQLMPWLAPREAELKAKIDKAYSRNDVKVTSTARSFAAPVKVAETAAVVTDDAEVEEAPEVTESQDSTETVGDSDKKDSTSDDSTEAIDEDSAESVTDEDEEAAAENDSAAAESEAAESDEGDDTDSGSEDSDSSEGPSSDESGSSDSGSSE